MKGKLALELNDIIYRMGDKIVLQLYKKEELVEGTIVNIFKSVHQPHEIHINLKELPLHVSVNVEEVEKIYKVH